MNFDILPLFVYYHISFDDISVYLSHMRHMTCTLVLGPCEKFHSKAKILADHHQTRLHIKFTNTHEPRIYSHMHFE